MYLLLQGKGGKMLGYDGKMLGYNKNWDKHFFRCDSEKCNYSAVYVAPDGYDLSLGLPPMKCICGKMMKEIE